MELCYCTGNRDKYREMSDIFRDKNQKKKDTEVEIKVTAQSKSVHIPELQHKDIEVIARQKAIDAYGVLFRPVLVEQTGLQIEKYDGLPDGLTGTMWEKIGEPGFVSLFQGKRVTAVSVLAYCDGKDVKIFKGSCRGMIVSPKGESRFQWDCIFAPLGYRGHTFAQLSSQEKNRISMRKKAADKLWDYLQRQWALEKIRDDSEQDEKEQSIIQELRHRIYEKKVILFVGSGLSRQFEMPTWTDLICKMGMMVGHEDKDVLMTLEKNLPALAEYTMLEHGCPNVQRNEIAQWLKSKEKEKQTIPVPKSYQLLSKMGFPYIYTTNYDHCIEDSFVKCIPPVFLNKVVNVEDLYQVDRTKSTLIKFHGDVDFPETMVLSERDYFRRLSLNSALDLHLRANMLEYSFLFIGYSLQDINMRYLFFRLHDLWQLSAKQWNQSLIPSSYIFLARPNPAEEKILHSYKIHYIRGRNDDPTEALNEFLEKLI